MTASAVELSELVSDFDAALVAGKLDRAANLAKQIEDANPEVSDVVTDFARALKKGEDRQARVLYGAVQRAYEAALARQAERAAQASALQTDPEVAVSDRQSAADFLTTAAEISVQRAKFVSSAGLAVSVEEPTSNMRTDLVEQAAELQQAEERAEATSNRVASAARSYDFPPMVAVSSVRFEGRQLTVGETGPVVVTLTNFGDEKAQSVSLEVETADGIEIVGESTAIESMNSDERVERTVRIAGNAVGEHSLRVTANVTNGRGSTDSVTIRVVDHLTLPLAVDTNDDGLIDTPEMQRAVKYWAAEKPVPNTDGTVPSEEDIRNLLVFWTEEIPV